MGTPRPRGGRARASNGQADRPLVTPRHQRLAVDGAAEGRGARGYIRKAYRRNGGAEPVPPDEAGLEKLADVPDDTQLEQAAGSLSESERKIFARVRQLLTERLGSPAAARLWLVTACSAFKTTPLAAVACGRGRRVLAVLEAQFEPRANLL